MMDGLNPKQKRFCQEYLKDLNGAQAAIRAGYSRNGADVQAVRLLSNAKIQTEIANLQQKRAQRTEITQDKVLNELARLGFANLADFITVQPDGSAFTDLSKVTREQMAAVQEITVDEFMDGRGAAARAVKRVKVKLADKRGALELIARHLGMFKDRVEHSGTVQNVMIYMPDNGRGDAVAAKLDKGKG